MQPKKTMTHFNVREAEKAMISHGAYLARYMGYQDDRPPTEEEIECWRESAMGLLQLTKVALTHIKELTR